MTRKKNKNCPSFKAYEAKPAKEDKYVPKNNKVQKTDGRYLAFLYEYC